MSDRDPLLASSDCWCKPRENDPGHWVHNSMDRREEYEQGRPLQ